MSETRLNKIRRKAIEVLENTPLGVRYSELVKQVHEAFPDFPDGTIHGGIWNLDKKLPGKIYKPARGIFRLTKYKDLESSQETEETIKVKEEDFYQPFANWLMNETEEATKAISLGRNVFKDKWGTPDVIGVRESKKSDIIKTPTEIISAEVKSSVSELITAFGQACSYKLFSNKVYLLIPNQSPETDVSRLDSLCLIFGIGLVLFDANNSKEPGFQIRVRPLKHDPDIFYTNKYLKIIEKNLFE